MATKLTAARQLMLYAAERYDTGERCDMEAGMAKLFASEVAMEIALDAMRIHGGYGYSTEYDVERYFRDAPLMIVGEGTNEIQRNVIAEQLVKRGGLDRACGLSSAHEDRRGGLAQRPERPHDPALRAARRGAGRAGPGRAPALHRRRRAAAAQAAGPAGREHRAGVRRTRRRRRRPRARATAGAPRAGAAHRRSAEAQARLDPAADFTTRARGLPDGPRQGSPGGAG